MNEPKRRELTLLGVAPIHPGRGEPSRIEMAISLDYLAGKPVERIVIDRFTALTLIESLARALRVVP